MIDHDASSPVPPRTLTWVRRHLGVGERITEIEQMSGGSTAEVRKLTVVAWAQPWREAGRTDLTPHVIEDRLGAYISLLMNGPKRAGDI